MAQQTLDNNALLSVQRAKINNNAADAVSKSDTTAQSVVSNFGIGRAVEGDWDPAGTVLAIGDGASIYEDADDISIVSNCYKDAVGWKYLADGPASRTILGDGEMINYAAVSGLAGDPITWQTGLQIKPGTGGAYMVGGAAPTEITTGAVNGACIDSSGIIHSSRSATDTQTHVIYRNNNGTIASAQTRDLSCSYRLANSVAGASFEWRNADNNQLLDIDYRGIITGTSGIPTDITTGAVQGACISNVGVVATSKTSTGSSTHLAFYNPNGQVGTITTNGTATAYNVSSDPRLKDFLPLPEDSEVNTEWEKAKGTLAKFTFKADPTKEVYGFDAHKAVDAELKCGLGSEGEGPRDAELGSVYDTTEEEYTESELVVDENGDAILDEEGNEQYQDVTKTRTIEHKVTPAGVDQAKLVPLLMLKIDQLERRLSALEGA